MKKAFVTVLNVLASIVAVGTAYAGGGAGAGSEQVVEQRPIEPVPWNHALCKLRYSSEPKYTLTVTSENHAETYRTYSDLCLHETAQYLGTIYFTESRVVIGMSGYGSEDFPLFSRYAVRTRR